ncbi:MAG: MATE family efflux transporter [Clostridium sp.]|uniref:MATE family efflux transporter n=1 Tax=Clostridium sp. TaxID=1506 RepID=UPI002FC7B257
MTNDSPNIMGTENVGKLLLKFSIPAIVGMLVNALYNIVDRIFVGQGVGTLALSGVTIAFPIMNIIMGFGMLVGIGATALISIRLGQQRHDNAEHIFGNAITLSVILSLAITVLGIIFLDPLLEAFGATGQVLSYSRDYMFIILLGNLFGTTSFGLNNVIRAEGNPKIAMATMIIGAIINAILNPVFIFGFDMGIKGAAIATIIAQLASLIWVIAHFYSSKSMLKIRKKYLILDLTIIRGIFAIGASPFAMQIAASAITVVMNKQLVYHGSDISIAVMGVVNAVTMFILMPIFGLNQGVQPIIGYNYGAKQYTRVKKALNLAIIAATVVSIVGYALVAIFPEPIIMLFANKSDPTILKEFLEQGTYAFRVYLCMLPIVGFQIVSSNYFQCVGKAKYSIFLSLSRQVIILLPLLFIMPRVAGLHGVYLAGPISDALSSLLTGIFITLEIKKLNKEIQLKQVI